jgi:ethanolamine utilization microcompartment shell protein EutS
VRNINKHLSDRKLEENEAKLDNVLHKILKAAHNIKDLNEDIKYTKDLGVIEERSKFIGILAETISTLTMLASEINFVDENITEELEGKIEKELDIAIENITNVRKLLE